MKKTFITIGLVFYLLVLYYILFFMHSRGYGSGISFQDYLKYCTNLIPFKTISFYIRSLYDPSIHINADTPIRNLSANLLMFIPSGIYLPYYFKRIKTWGSFLLPMLALLVLVELIQFLTRRGSFDIDDLLLNMVSGSIGYLIWSIPIVKRLLQKHPQNTEVRELPPALSE